MENPVVEKINSWIRYCFYALFILVPLVMWPSTSELFEFNKMWTVYGITLIICLLWISKITITRQFQVRRTPLDIPILLFLASQFISTLMSIDPHVSWWGYYSRFNGGLFSIIAYIFLYYAYATHVISKKTPLPRSVKMLAVTLITGIIVALWGLPSHFGADPTCLFFRGSLDTSCWTPAFQPTVRIFSTLGQPNWLAAYLAVLLPIAIAFGIFKLKKINTKKIHNVQALTKSLTAASVVFFMAAVLFYLDILYTKSQSGFIGLWAGLAVSILLFIVISLRYRSDDTGAKPLHHFPIHSKITLIAAFIVLLLMSFFQGVPISQLERFTRAGMQTEQSKPADLSPAERERAEQQAGPALEVGGSSSGKIRLIVWEGALKIFQNNPIFGTGPETFAYAYYKVRPTEHNLTSEWDYLYNKAHNEYLNYLATTGIAGLASYAAIILLFFVTVIRLYLRQEYEPKYTILGIAIIGGYTSLLVSNFFGFSVVIINLFFFLLPLWFYDITSHQTFTNKLKSAPPDARLNAGNATVITVFGLIVLISLFNLFRSWRADQHYALGNNLNKVNEFVQAWPELEKAVEMRPTEDLFKDELAVNLSTLALALNEQKQTTQAAQFAQRAKMFSDEVVADHPHNVVYWKSRTRILYTLAEINPQYTAEALAAIQRASELAPTDAKIIYNLALLYNLGGDKDRAIDTVEQAVQLKPNYTDARYTLSLYYIEKAKAALERGNTAEHTRFNDLARSELDYILKNIDPAQKEVQELLKSI